MSGAPRFFVSRETGRLYECRGYSDGDYDIHPAGDPSIRPNWVSARSVHALLRPATAEERPTPDPTEALLCLARIGRAVEQWFGEVTDDAELIGSDTTECGGYVRGNSDPAVLARRAQLIRELLTERQQSRETSVGWDPECMGGGL